MGLYTCTSRLTILLLSHFFCKFLFHESLKLRPLMMVLCEASGSLKPNQGKLLFWWPFGKILFSESNFIKSDFNIKSNIAFIHFELTPFFVTRLPSNDNNFWLRFFSAQGGFLFGFFSSSWSEEWGRRKCPYRRCCFSGGSHRTSTISMIPWSCFSCTFSVETS